MYNPHLVNIVEPGLDGSEMNAKMSHSIFFDEALYERLVGLSNRSGRLHSYEGVIEGYAVGDIKKAFDLPNLTDTGVCLSDAIVAEGLAKRPEVPFNENKHRRYVQASESYITRLRRHAGKTAISKIHRPEVFGLNRESNFEQVALFDF